MPISLKHTTQATGTDAGNGEIRKAQWNEEHTLTLASGKLLGRYSASTGAAEEINISTGLSLDASGNLTASGGGGSTLTIDAKTAAYTVVSSDAGKIINCTANTFTVSLTAAATLGSGFNCWIWNTGTGVITIDPNGGETIDGFATRILRPQEGLQIICNGTNWVTGSNKSLLLYAENLQRFDRPRPIAGQNSVSIGLESTATGLTCIALGYTTTASGEGSLSTGILSQATATYATAIGYDARATANSAMAIGSNTSFGGSRAGASSATAIGGSNASGSGSFAAAIANNTTSFGSTNNNSISIGNRAKSTGSQATAIGNNSSATSEGSMSLSTDLGTGFGCQSTAFNAIAIGYGTVSSIRGKFAFTAHPLGNSVGSSQMGLFVLVGQTTTTTPVVLTTDNNAGANNNQIILPNNSSYTFMGTIVAKRQATGADTAGWKIEGLIRREASAGTTTLIASTVTAISNTPGWTLALSADTTNGGLAVTATGAASTNIRWVANIQTSELTY